MARCILCCFKCCLWCLEKFIKFLNRNAYIMVSTAPSNPCPVPLGSASLWASSPGRGPDLPCSS